MIYNLCSERQWLEEETKIQRQELEKSQKNLTDVERSARCWKKISNEGTEVLFASWTGTKKNILK